MKKAKEKPVTRMSHPLYGEGNISPEATILWIDGKKARETETQLRKLPRLKKLLVRKLGKSQAGKLSGKPLSGAVIVKSGTVFVLLHFKA